MTAKKVDASKRGGGTNSKPIPPNPKSVKKKGPANGGRTNRTTTGISQVTVVGSNLKHTGLKSLLKSLAGTVNPDKGVLVDPFEHLETNQYLKKTDTTDCVLQARQCITREELSKIDFFSTASIAQINISRTAVHRLMWTPPYVIQGPDKISPEVGLNLLGDRRGVFSDLDKFHIKFKNVLSQPIVVSLNSPRSRIQEVGVIQFRDFERRITIQPGATHEVSVHWGDKSNIKAPLIHLIQTEAPKDASKQAPALPVIEVIDYMIEYPNVDREANTVYMDDTEVVSIRATMGYVVNVNYPPQIGEMEDRPIFMTIGSQFPNEDLFGLKGITGYVTVKTDESRVSLRNETTEQSYPFVGLAPENKGTPHKLCVVNRDRTNWRPVELPLQKSVSGLRITVPGIAISREGIIYSLFAFSPLHKGWVLWDEYNNKPLEYHLSNPENTFVNSGVKALILDTSMTGGGSISLSISDIIGFLDSITHVVGLVAGVVGLFA